jgi:hypothetical protein
LAGRAFAVSCILAGLLSGLSLASQVRQVNLEEMTRRAARIFSGRCIQTSVEYDASLGRHITVATFRVRRAVKGVAGDTVTVRMLGGGAPGDSPAGVPQYRRGDEVVLFLYGESALGLSSTVGLGQGSFKVLTDKQGRRVALNDAGNRNLLREMRPEARERLRGLRERPDDEAAATDLGPDSLLDMAGTLLDAEPRR